MKLLWVVTCICCTFSIWLWNLYAHIPTPKDVRNIPPTKKSTKKKHNTFSRSGYQKVKPPKNHTSNQHLTSRSNPPFQTSPPNRSEGFQPPGMFFSSKQRGDGTSALLIHWIFIAFRFQQHSHNVHIAKLCCCRHGRTTMLILSWCEKMSLSERKNGSGEYEIYRYEWGGFWMKEDVFPMVVLLLWIWIWWSHHVLIIFTCECVLFWIQWIFSWKVIPCFTLLRRHVGKNLCNPNLFSQVFAPRNSHSNPSQVIRLSRLPQILVGAYIQQKPRQLLTAIGTCMP